jgi:hypothetical protein
VAELQLLAVPQIAGRACQLLSTAGRQGRQDVLGVVQVLVKSCLTAGGGNGGLRTGSLVVLLTSPAIAVL